MIIQKVIKGISDINLSDARAVLETGIRCSWWWKVKTLPFPEIAERLTPRNLDWHQNRYNEPDPLEGNEIFGQHTPFISTTAGTVERDSLSLRNTVQPAWQVALEFATQSGLQSGYLFYCYLFVLGTQSIPHQPFSEEIRELNLYTGWSEWQLEGEITAKIVIPTTQIEKFEYYDINDIQDALTNGRRPSPTTTEFNARYFADPQRIVNIRDFLV